MNLLDNLERELAESCLGVDHHLCHQVFFTN